MLNAAALKTCCCLFTQQRHRLSESHSVAVLSGKPNRLAPGGLPLQGNSKYSETCGSLLQNCIDMESLAEGKRVHAIVIQSPIPNLFLFNNIINMYLKCGSFSDAWQMFDRMTDRNVFTWTILITAYSKHGFALGAFVIFNQMLQEGEKPNHVTLSCLLTSSAELTSLEWGKLVHGILVKSKNCSDVFVKNTLLKMYLKCGTVGDAHQIFNEMPMKDVVTWNIMIAGHVHHRSCKEALLLFKKMHQLGMVANKITFLHVLGACEDISDLRMVHASVMKNGFELDVFVGCTMIDIYAKCGSINDAYQIFVRLPSQDVASWNTIILAFARHDKCITSVNLFWKMQDEGIKADRITFINVFGACSGSNYLIDEARKIQGLLPKFRLQADTYVLSALLDMYVKAGFIGYALEVFNATPVKNSVLYTAMIGGYVAIGDGIRALDLFKEMQSADLSTDRVALINALSACACIGALKQGKQIQSDMMKAGIDLNLNVQNVVIDMYAKCGSIKEAKITFDTMWKRDSVSWTTMISAYALHADDKEACKHFRKMQQEGFQPDEITYASVLAACSHGGLMDQGCNYFNAIAQTYNIRPNMEHHACLADLLCRAGFLSEANDLMESMPQEPNDVIWTIFLGGCNIHCDMQLAKCTLMHILNLGPGNAPALILLSNIYAADNMDHKVDFRNISISVAASRDHWNETELRII